MSSSDFPAWYTIKPEADIFTDMICEYGVDGFIARDVFNIEDYNRLSEETTFGFIFSYKTEAGSSQDISTENPEDSDIIFTSQVIDNSCSTLSLLNIFFNIDIGNEGFIKAFLNYTKDFSSTDRGIAFAKSPAFEKIHNSYDINENKTKTPYRHYISYLFKDNAIWEIDNLKPSPTKVHYLLTDENWLAILKTILRTKIETGACNLIAITKDPIFLKQNELTSIRSDIRGLETKLMGIEKRLFQPKTSKTVRLSDLSKEGRKTLGLKRRLEKRVKQLETDIKQLKLEALRQTQAIWRRKFEYFPTTDLKKMGKKKSDNTPGDEEAAAIENDAPQENTPCLSLKEPTETPSSSQSSSKAKGKKRSLSSSQEGESSGFIKRLLPARAANKSTGKRLEMVLIEVKEEKAKVKKPKKKEIAKGEMVSQEEQRRLRSRRRKAEEPKQKRYNLRSKSDK